MHALGTKKKSQRESKCILLGVQVISRTPTNNDGHSQTNRTKLTNSQASKRNHKKRKATNHRVLLVSHDIVMSLLISLLFYQLSSHPYPMPFHTKYEIHLHLPIMKPKKKKIKINNQQSRRGKKHQTKNQKYKSSSPKSMGFMIWIAFIRPW